MVDYTAEALNRTLNRGAVSDQHKLQHVSVPGHTPSLYRRMSKKILNTYLKNSNPKVMFDASS